MSTVPLSDIPPERLENEDDHGLRRYPNNSSMGCNGRTNLVIAVVVVVACCALILGIVGVSKPWEIEFEYEPEFNGVGPGGMGYVAPQDRVWTFAIGHSDTNLEYLDEASGTIKGYNVDIINSVCKIANKKCELVYDTADRCWSNTGGDRARGGEGLLAGWYDICTGWGITYDRARTYSFTNEYSKLPGVGVYVANSTMNFNWEDLRGRKIGFINAFSSDPVCLARYTDLIQGAKLSGNLITFYPDADTLVSAVIDGSVAAAFCYAEPQLTMSLKRVTEVDFPNRCAHGGFGMMVKKGQTDFVSWWNDAFDKLVNTVEYRLICEDLKKQHGSLPGRSPAEVCLGY